MVNGLDDPFLLQSDVSFLRAGVLVNGVKLKVVHTKWTKTHLLDRELKEGVDCHCVNPKLPEQCLGFS